MNPSYVNGNNTSSFGFSETGGCPPDLQNLALNSFQLQSNQPPQAFATTFNHTAQTSSHLAKGLPRGPGGSAFPSLNSAPGGNFSSCALSGLAAGATQGSGCSHQNLAKENTERSFSFGLGKASSVPCAAAGFTGPRLATGTRINGWGGAHQPPCAQLKFGRSFPPRPNSGPSGCQQNGSLGVGGGASVGGPTPRFTDWGGPSNRIPGVRCTFSRDSSSAASPGTSGYGTDSGRSSANDSSSSYDSQISRFSPVSGSRMNSNPGPSYNGGPQPPTPLYACESDPKCSPAAPATASMAMCSDNSGSLYSNARQSPTTYPYPHPHGAAALPYPAMQPGPSSTYSHPSQDYGGYSMIGDQHWPAPMGPFGRHHHGGLDDWTYPGYPMAPSAQNGGFHGPQSYPHAAAYSGYRQGHGAMDGLHDYQTHTMPPSMSAGSPTQLTLLESTPASGVAGAVMAGSPPGDQGSGGSNGNGPGNVSARQHRPPYEWMRSTPTAPAPGKTRTKDKYRVVYTDQQRLELEKEFHFNKYINLKRKTELAKHLVLSERQVKIWFQNRRAKERKQRKKMIESVHKDLGTPEPSTSNPRLQRDVKPYLSLDGSVPGMQMGMAPDMLPSMSQSLQHQQHPQHQQLHPLSTPMPSVSHPTPACSTPASSSTPSSSSSHNGGFPPTMPNHQPSPDDSPVAPDMTSI